MEMDFHGMKRKDLQTLCKKHGIPANLKNIDMATRLASVLKKEDEETVIETKCSLEDDSVEEENLVGIRKAKRVRFSPESENEVFEFTRSVKKLQRKIVKKRSHGTAKDLQQGRNVEPRRSKRTVSTVTTVGCNSSDATKAHKILRRSKRIHSSGITQEEHEESDLIVQERFEDKDIQDGLVFEKVGRRSTRLAAKTNNSCVDGGTLKSRTLLAAKESKEERTMQSFETKTAEPVVISENVLDSTSKVSVDVSLVRNTQHLYSVFMEEGREEKQEQDTIMITAVRKNSAECWNESLPSKDDERGSLEKEEQSANQHGNFSEYIIENNSAEEQADICTVGRITAGHCASRKTLDEVNDGSQTQFVPTMFSERGSKPNALELLSTDFASLSPKEENVSECLEEDKSLMFMEQLSESGKISAADIVTQHNDEAVEFHAVVFTTPEQVLLLGDSGLDDVGKEEEHTTTEFPDETDALNTSQSEAINGGESIVVELHDETNVAASPLRQSSVGDFKGDGIKQNEENRMVELHCDSGTCTRLNTHALSDGAENSGGSKAMDYEESDVFTGLEERRLFYGDSEQKKAVKTAEEAAAEFQDESDVPNIPARHPFPDESELEEAEKGEKNKDVELQFDCDLFTSAEKHLLRETDEGMKGDNRYAKSHSLVMKVSVDVSLVRNAQVLHSEVIEGGEEKQEQDQVMVTATKNDKEVASSLSELFVETTQPSSSVQLEVSNPESKPGVPTGHVLVKDTAEECIETEEVPKSVHSFVAKLAETDAVLGNSAECWNESLPSKDDERGSLEKEKQSANQHGKFSAYNTENSSAEEQADICKVGHCVSRETLDEVKDDNQTKSVPTMFSERCCKPNALELLSTDFASLSPKEENVSECLEEDEMKALSQPIPINKAASNPLDRSSAFTTFQRNLTLLEQLMKSGKISATDDAVESHAVVFTTPEQVLLLGDSGLDEVGKEEEHTATDFPDESDVLNTSRSEAINGGESIVVELHDECNVAVSPLRLSSVGDFKGDGIKRNEENRTGELHCESGTCTSLNRYALLGSFVSDGAENIGGIKATEFCEERHEIFEYSGQCTAREGEVKKAAQFDEEAGLSTGIQKDNADKSGLCTSPERQLLYGDSEQKKAVQTAEKAAEFHDESDVPNIPARHPFPEESELEDFKGDGIKRNEDNRTVELHCESGTCTSPSKHALLGSFVSDGAENSGGSKTTEFYEESIVFTGVEERHENFGYSGRCTAREGEVKKAAQLYEETGLSTEIQKDNADKSDLCMSMERQLLYGDSEQKKAVNTAEEVAAEFYDESAVPNIPTRHPFPEESELEEAEKSEENKGVELQVDCDLFTGAEKHLLLETYEGMKGDNRKSHDMSDVLTAFESHSLIGDLEPNEAEKKYRENKDVGLLSESNISTNLERHLLSEGCGLASCLESFVFSSAERQHHLGNSEPHTAGKEVEFPDESHVLNTSQSEAINGGKSIIVELRDESDIAASPLRQSSVGDFKGDGIEQNEENRTVELHCESGNCTSLDKHALLGSFVSDGAENSGGSKAMKFYEESDVFIGLEERHEISEYSGQLLYVDSEQKKAVKTAEEAAAEFHDEFDVPNIPARHPFQEESELEEAEKSKENKAVELQVECDLFTSAEKHLLLETDEGMNGDNRIAKSQDMSNVLTASESHSLIGDFEPNEAENKYRENKDVELLSEYNIFTNLERHLLSGDSGLGGTREIATCVESFVFSSPERLHHLGNSEPHTAGKEVEFKDESAFVTRLKSRLLLGESEQNQLGNSKSGSSQYQSHHASSPRVILKDVSALDVGENIIAGGATPGAEFISKSSQAENVASLDATQGTSKQSRGNSPHVDSVNLFDYDIEVADTTMDAERTASFSSYVLALPAKGNSEIVGEITSPLKVSGTSTLMSEESSPSTNIQNQINDELVEKLAITDSNEVDELIESNNTQRDHKGNLMLHYSGGSSVSGKTCILGRTEDEHLGCSSQEDLRNTCEKSGHRILEDEANGSIATAFVSTEKSTSLTPNEFTVQDNINKEEGDSETIGEISSHLEVGGTCCMVSAEYKCSYLCLHSCKPYTDIQNQINDTLEELATNNIEAGELTKAKSMKNVDSSGGSSFTGMTCVLAGTEDAHLGFTKDEATDPIATAFEKDISLTPDGTTVLNNINEEDEEMVRREATPSPEETLNESSGHRKECVNIGGSGTWSEKKQVRREPILVYRTQVKPKRHDDMKENAPNSKIVDNLNVTAPRKSRRQPLQDLRKN